MPEGRGFTPLFDKLGKSKISLCDFGELLISFRAGFGFFGIVGQKRLAEVSRFRNQFALGYANIQAGFLLSSAKASLSTLYPPHIWKMQPPNSRPGL